MMEKLAPQDRPVAGPFDSNEVELPINHLDFGSIRLVPRPDLAIRLEVEEQTNRVVALTLELNDSTLQVSAFAASKDDGVWQEVIDQLGSSITQVGGKAVVSSCGVGTCLDTDVLQTDGSFKKIRFIGVDGPRWFLRGSITGVATTDAQAAYEIEEVFRSLVVHRGTAPMPPREPLELVVPAGIIPPRPGL